MLKNLVKWSVLVLLSSVASVVAAVLMDYSTPHHLLGMVLGIATFIVAYALVDSWLVKSGREELSRALRLAVYIKMGLQLAPVVETGAGLCAGLLLDPMIGSMPVMVYTYLMTLVVGLLLSLVVALFTAIIRGVFLLSGIPLVAGQQ